MKLIIGLIALFLLSGCEEKTTRDGVLPRFRYNQEVVVVHGFFAGQTGKLTGVKGYYSDCRVAYWLELRNGEKIYACETDLVEKSN